MTQPTDEWSGPTDTHRVSAITANLGCGGPHPLARRDAADRWLKDVGAGGVDLLFLQEVPDNGCLERLEPTYTVHLSGPDAPTYRCRSAIAVRRDRGWGSRTLAVETSGYHGSYVASATIAIPGLAPWTLVSVHASPTPVEKRYAQLWPWGLPEPRRGVGRHQLWDSDMCLATVGHLACSGPTLAAGDWNEARAWDEHYRGHWGQEFFERAAGYGLDDPLKRLWREERPTTVGYQDDHILATPVVAAMVSNADVVPSLDPDCSDHHPVRFEIALEASAVSPTAAT